MGKEFQAREFMKREKMLLVLAGLLLACGVEAKEMKCRYRVEFPSRDNAVLITDVPAWAKGATVWYGDEEIPSQLDDLDGDGRFEELAFVYEGLPTEGTLGVHGADFRVVYSSEPVEHSYPARVNAQMWLKNSDKSLTEVSGAESTRDDMYHKLHHHGPAFESELAAYRVYFDKKQSIDTYGKKHPGLELRESMWYPLDEQLAEGFGHDNLRVFGSISVGVLKGWNAEKKRMEHITQMRRREACIRAAGPVRTVVDMRVEGWQYQGREINMTSRYILYAGHADVQVENRLEGEWQGLRFTTGVMKICDGFTATLCDSVLVSTGVDFPENDTVRWQREQVALVVALPGRQIASRVDDAKSHLVQLEADAQGCIDYRLWMFWRKSEWLDAALWEQAGGLATLGGWSECLHKPRVRRLK